MAGDAFRVTGCFINSWVSLVVANKAVKCPPDDSPHAPNRFGSRLNCFALSRKKLTAARQSLITAGKISSRLLV